MGNFDLENIFQPPPETTVVHCKRENYDVYIGRPSKWGNPFAIGKDGDRAEVITKYTQWISGQPELLDSIDELIGKTLGCWCAPQACHGDVLAFLANWKSSLDESSS